MRHADEWYKKADEVILHVDKRCIFRDEWCFGEIEKFISCYLLRNDLLGIHFDKIRRKDCISTGLDK
jgi:hypothetical protein